MKNSDGYKIIRFGGEIIAVEAPLGVKEREAKLYTMRVLNLPVSMLIMPDMDDESVPCPVPVEFE